MTPPHLSLELANEFCQRQGERFTPTRKTVYRLLLDQEKPVSAYDLLDNLKQEMPNAKPPTVYRALEFLLRLGLAHKIESTNSYVSCDHFHHKHRSEFLLCESCGQVVELTLSEQAQQVLLEEAKKLGFEVHDTSIELRGRCSQCLKQAHETNN